MVFFFQTFSFEEVLAENLVGTRDCSFSAKSYLRPLPGTLWKREEHTSLCVSGALPSQQPAASEQDLDSLHSETRMEGLSKSLNIQPVFAFIPRVVVSE